jgi:hypothetical protein
MPVFEKVRKLLMKVCSAAVFGYRSEYVVENVESQMRI